jgi:hypothetical protein
VSSVGIVFLINLAAAIANIALWVSLRAARRRADWELRWTINARNEATELLAAAAHRAVATRHDRDTWKFARIAAEANRFAWKKVRTEAEDESE